MYKPIATGIGAIILAASLYAGNAGADEPSPYAIKPGEGKKAVPTLIQKLMREYCAAHKDSPVCESPKPNSAFGGLTPEEALGMNSNK